MFLKSVHCIEVICYPYKSHEINTTLTTPTRYRKITLRPEQPLFNDDKQSDSEDEGDKNSSGEESHWSVTCSLMLYSASCNLSQEGPVLKKKSCIQ